MSKFNYVDHIFRINQQQPKPLNMSGVTGLTDSFFTGFQNAMNLSEQFEQNRLLEESREQKMLDDKSVYFNDQPVQQPVLDIPDTVDNSSQINAVSNGVKNLSYSESSYPSFLSVPTSSEPTKALQVAQVTFDSTLTPAQRQARLLSDNTNGQKFSSSFLNQMFA